jgi:hypothetical protein
MSEATRILSLRIVLALVCISHLVLGLGIMLGGAGVLETLGASYGVNHVPTDPQFLYILKPLGAYMLAISFLAGAAFYAPLQNRIAVDCVILLLLVRVGQRVVFGSEAMHAFGISSGHLIAQSLFYFAFAAALFIFRPRPEHAPVPAEPGA